MNKRIAVAAQSFGYGPCSKLATILELLKPKATFFGNTTALTFAKMNKAIFSRIIETENNKYFDINFSEFNYSIAIMDYDFSISAWWNNNKYIYVDSLFWFWDWSKIKKEKLNLFSELKAKRNLEAFKKEWSALDPHSKQYYAHYYSERSVIQKYADNSKHMHLFDNKEFVEVGPIINDTLKKKAKRTKIVVSYCGLLSPLVNKERALEYIAMTKTILDSILPNDKKNIFFLMNPEIKKDCKKILQNSRIEALGHEETLKLLNRTKAMILPPSITSILESIEYGVPVILLPEEHDGHYPNYLELKRKANGNNYFNGFIIQELLTKQGFCGDEREQTNKIHACLKKIQTAIPKEWKTKTTQYRKLLQNEKELQKLSEVQKQSFNLLPKDNISNHLSEMIL